MIGKYFGLPDDILLKIPADLEDLKQAVKACPYTERSPHGDIKEAGKDERFKKAVWDLLDPLFKVKPTLVQRLPSIRIKPSPDAGRYDTSILHTDLWSGNPGSVVMIPIEGDFETGGVEFYRPTITHDLVRLHTYYADAPDTKPVYLGKMEPGFIYVLDPTCLHRTMIGGHRVSVDVRLVWGDPVFRRKKNYVKYEDIWQT